MRRHGFILQHLQKRSRWNPSDAPPFACSDYLKWRSSSLPQNSTPFHSHGVIRTMGKVPDHHRYTPKSVLDETEEDYFDEPDDDTEALLGGGPTRRLRGFATERDFVRHRKQQEIRGRRDPVQLREDMWTAHMPINTAEDPPHYTPLFLHSIPNAAAMPPNAPRHRTTRTNAASELRDSFHRSSSSRRETAREPEPPPRYSFNRPSRRGERTARDPRTIGRRRRRRTEEHPAPTEIQSRGGPPRIPYEEEFEDEPEEDEDEEQAWDGDDEDEEGIDRSGRYFYMDPHANDDLPHVPFDHPEWNHVRPLDYSMFDHLLPKQKTPEELAQEAQERRARFDAVMELYEQGREYEWKTEAVFANACYNNDVDLILWLYNKDCPWDASAPASAALGGHFKLLQFLHEFGCPWDTTTCAMAATRDDMMFLEYAREHLAEWDEETTVNAACNPDEEVLKYCVKNGCPMDDRVTALAAWHGHLEHLKYARKQFCDWTEAVCTNAAAQGHLPVLSWAREHGCPWNIAQVCAQAALNGQLDVLKWVYTNSEGQCEVEWNAETCDGAAWNGYLSILQWVRAYDCPWDASVCASAAHNGHWILLQWARGNGCPWNAETCANIALNAVPKTVNFPLQMLEWARTEGCEWDQRTCSNAGLSGNLPLLQYARANDCPWDPVQTCANAALKGHWHILQWVRENGGPSVFDVSVCANAAQGGHLEILQWLRLEQECPWDTSTCSHAALNGHLAVLQWAREHGCPWDAETCATAALNGHFRLLQWARENKCPWDERTCANAALMGHWNILKWARRGAVVIYEPDENDEEVVFDSDEDESDEKKKKKPKVKEPKPVEKQRILYRKRMGLSDTTEEDALPNPPEKLDSKPSSDEVATKAGTSTAEGAAAEDDGDKEMFHVRPPPVNLGRPKCVIVNNEEECCPWNEETCTNAAQGAHFDILKWARMNGCNWNKDVLTYARMNRDQNIFYWALSNGCNNKQYTLLDPEDENDMREIRTAMANRTCSTIFP